MKMKILAFIFCFVNSVISANAQIEFGLKAGLNISNLKYSGTPVSNSFDNKTGFNAGVLMSLPINNLFIIQPEVMYSEQGTNSELQDVPGVGNVSSNYNYNYLNIPVLFKYQHPVGIFLETGPQIGFLLNANTTTSGQNIDLKNFAQSTDFSWVFGVGYKIPIINLGFDARCNLGCTQINKSGTTGTSKNSVFQLGLFYLFAKI